MNETIENPMRTFPDRSQREEFYNTVTHLFGFGLSLAGGVALLPKAWLNGDPWLIAACTLFVLSMAALYLSSALSHAFRDPERQDLFRRLDQAFIYCLIVGTYAPFVAVYYPRPWMPVFFLVIWLLAAAGCVSKLFWSHQVNAVSVGTYLGLGWLLAAAWIPFYHHLPLPIMGWMLGGGLLYTLGTRFLKYDAHSTWFHPIWHLFVIGGSLVHYLAILWYVVPG